MQVVHCPVKVHGCILWPVLVNIILCEAMETADVCELRFTMIYHPPGDHRWAPVGDTNIIALRILL